MTFTLKGLAMNISQSSGGYAEPTFSPPAGLPQPLPSSLPQGNATTGSGPTYDGGVTPQNPVSLMPSAMNGAQVMAQNQQPLQDQQLSGGLVGSIEQMLSEFLEKLKSLLKMISGENDGPQGAAPVQSSAVASQPQLTADPVSASGAAPSPQVRMASVPMASGDTSMKTSDPDLQKLVNKFGPEYAEASKETGVPAKLLVAQTMQESGGDVNATSTNPGNGKTDSGMNQINPDTYAAMRKAHPDKLGANITDPKNQIMCSALMLKEGKEKFGSYDAALRAYNSGDDQVDKNNLSHVTIGDPNYVKEVNAYAAKFS